ncbi:MAG: hypothetical protein JJE04_01455 [Acidobacteriia bacterium]|nr:hypothetical protein [Terriglobia bacterium]
MSSSGSTIRTWSTSNFQGWSSRREIHRGRFALWDPHIWMGQPLIGQTQPGPVNPLNLLMMLWPLDANGYLRVRVLNLYFVAMHAVAALGLYWLGRELKRSRAASILAACAFSFGGFVGSAPWLDVLNGALWTPLVALFFLRAARGIRPAESAAWSGLVLGVAWLSGHHETPLLTTLALGGAWLAAIVLQQPRLRVAAMGRAALTFLIAGLVAAAQMWPTVEFGRLAMRWGPAGPGPVGWKDKIPYLSSSIYSFTPRGLLGIVFPDQGTNADSSAFLGVVVSSLALLGLVTAWRHPAVRWVGVLAGASLIYAMGEFTPVHGVLNTLVPMLDKARVPVRALHLTNFAAAVLAAYGVDRLLRGRARVWSLRITKALALAGAGILLGALGWKLEASEALILSAFVSIAWLGLTAAWASGRVSRAVCCVLMAVLMIAELNTTLTRGWLSRFAEKSQPFARQLEAHRDLAGFLRREPAPTRVRVNDHDVPVNFGDLHSIDMYEGYSAGVTLNLLHYGRHTLAGQRLYGVTHYIGRQADRPDLVKAFEGADGVKVFRSPNALARARSVHVVETVAHAALLAGRIEDPAFDAARSAVLVGAESPRLETCEGGDKVEMAAYAPNRVRIRAEMRCRGMIVLADTFFPGWQARVDGKPARIWEAYGAVRGVVVEAGRHEVDFRFRPVAVFGGVALTALGLLAALFLTLTAQLRARRM